MIGQVQSALWYATDYSIPCTRFRNPSTFLVRKGLDPEVGNPGHGPTVSLASTTSGSIGTDAAFNRREVKLASTRSPGLLPLNHPQYPTSYTPPTDLELPPVQAVIMEDPTTQQQPAAASPSLPVPTTLEPEPISRPSSTSTQASAPQNMSHMLPGIASIATTTTTTTATATNNNNNNNNNTPATVTSPQPRPMTMAAPPMIPPGTSPAASSHPGPGGNLSRLATQSGGWQWINVTKSQGHGFAENGNDCHWPKSRVLVEFWLLI
ncbi:hypothetical protein QR685DRAFT_542860 [Neurospora intermedia]|uniref:Uncharacterized protein n=1 Tax=Neurospora intermedia TaxID=5142 RepID=A0ABR3DG44_NEUIN